MDVKHTNRLARTAKPGVQTLFWGFARAMWFFVYKRWMLDYKHSVRRSFRPVQASTKSKNQRF